MHELDASRGLARKVRSILEKEDARQAVVNLELGALSTYSQDPIRFYFERLKEDDEVLRGIDIKLNIISRRGTRKCSACGSTFEIDEIFESLCEECGSMDSVIIDGKDLVIKSIEVN